MKWRNWKQEIDEDMKSLFDPKRKNGVEDNHY